MNKDTFERKLANIIYAMNGQKVMHKTYGEGTIVGIVDQIVIIRFEELQKEKDFFMYNFIKFNTPLNQDFNDKIKKLYKDYESSNEEEEVEESNENKITFDDVIGLDSVKEQINKMIVYPFKYKEIYEAFKRYSGGGILLYGPPGTGKTMIAKAVSNEIKAKFFSIKCSDILSKWYGESEKKIKELFTEARLQEKSIIFFDEFDSIAISRNDTDDNNNHRIVSELLSQIDGVESKGNNSVLLIAATNRPWDIDSAFLRPGRFNKQILIGLPDQEAKELIILHELKDLPYENIDEVYLASKMDMFSSADVVEACNEAKDKAILRSIGKGVISPINMNDFLEALKSIRSTIKAEDMKRLVMYSDGN